MSNKFTVIADAKVLPEHVEDFKRAVEKILEPTRNEEGNLRYDFCQSIDEPTQFVFFENWESEQHLQKHLESEHMSEFFSAVGPVMVKAPDIYHAALTKL